MMKTRLGPASAVAAAILAVPTMLVAALAGSPMENLYGHWQVVDVAVPGDGVQALAPNDPAYMGRQLTFSPTSLSWDKPKSDSTEAPCRSPTIAPTLQNSNPESRATVRKIGGPALQAFSVACAGSSWGPNDPPAPVILTMRDGTIGLWWYDNGLLKLRRTK